ncbi:MAG: ferritin [bacterium]|nr:ferritin [bacterium]
MLSKKMEKALNEQINAELYSSYLYLAMSAHFADQNLEGFANWMRIQAQEELAHAMKFFDHIIERDGQAKLAAIKGPESTFKAPLEIFQAAFEHEKYISGRINDLVTLAIKENDHASNNFLQWFVGEQVEEEATANGIVQQLKLIGKDAAATFHLDIELAKRIFTPPV